MIKLFFWFIHEIHNNSQCHQCFKHFTDGDILSGWCLDLLSEEVVNGEARREASLESSHDYFSLLSHNKRSVS